MRVAIIGGGIAGLAAAFEAEKAGYTYVVFEGDQTLGGSIQSQNVNGCIVEAGPDSFMTEKPAVALLCAELGLSASLVGSNDESRKTYILLRKRLVPMPDGLMFMVPTRLLATAATRLFSLRTKLRMARELLHPPRPMLNDESVAQLVERHFGAEVVDRLADPLLSGIYGGDCAVLSARAVLPRLVEMEERYGSLSRGMLAAHRRLRKAKGGALSGAPPLFSTFSGGMQQLVDAIESRLAPGSIRLGSRVRSIARCSTPSGTGFDGGESQEYGWWVKSEEQQPTGNTERIQPRLSLEFFDSVVVATPAWIAGALLQKIAPETASDLAAIPYSSSITVTLAYDGRQIPQLPAGFGFLVPASENRDLLACTFVHRKFPGRAPAGTVLLRSFLGGARNEALLNEDDSTIEATVREELRQILGIAVTPLFVRIFRNRQAMAQYTVGHQDRTARIAAAVAGIPHLALAGNAYQGIGVPDCIRSGQQAMAKISQDSLIGMALAGG